MEMQPRTDNLNDDLINKLNSFITSNNFIDLYKSYKWENDTYKNGFPDILKLELQLSRNDKKGGILLSDVKDVANWGKLRNPKRIAGNMIALPQNTLHEKNGTPNGMLNSNPVLPICLLQENVTKGIGPTYLSKVIRFGLPQEYGAIDTKCVRVFGKGDSINNKHSWLSIRARNDGYGWYITKQQSAWPNSYGIWIDILRYFSGKLSNNCPHPQGFVTAELRNNNEWECADVEMALFSYASRFV